jgi:hypothetical protein
MELNEHALTLLAAVEVDMHTAGKTALYNIPAGKTAVITGLIIHSPSATLAGGTDYDFGTGPNADTWKTAVDLSSLTTPYTDFMPISLAAKSSVCEELSEFGVMVNTGANGAATVQIDVFGYLY